VSKINRRNVPPGNLRHLLDRIQERGIEASQLGAFARWLDTEPEVAEGPWYKRFSGMIVCGEGEWVQTFLLPGHAPRGKKVD
jgi:hypothetical protein